MSRRLSLSVGHRPRRDPSRRPIFVLRVLDLELRLEIASRRKSLAPSRGPLAPSHLGRGFGVREYVPPTSIGR
jgi:hypothetical protein